MQQAFLQISNCSKCSVLVIWSFPRGREAAQFASQRSQLSPPQAVQHEETKVQKQCRDHLALSSRKAASSEMLLEYCTSHVPALLEAFSTILRI